MSEISVGNRVPGIMKLKLFRKLTVAFALLIASFATAFAAEEKPSLLVLGVSHFSHSGRDFNNVEVDNMLSPRRQKEIEELLVKLAKFEPTHIAVEVSRSRQAQLTERYKNYLVGKHTLANNEVEQLGFRLAQMFDHQSVFAVDWNGNPPGDLDADYDWTKAAEENDQQSILNSLSSPERLAEYVVKLDRQSVSTWLRELNASERLLASHQSYFDIARIGNDEQLVGANWVGTWYARNLKIFTKVAELANQKDARILLIYGQGHAYLLTQFARESSHFSVVAVEDFLD